ncbi:HD repeat domain-containing protein [Scenedesmus sp. NREL 46B-D3]|nr:HD repeat domain-containing protein [Scenedesmus sp. NREL 46B-D3]
MALDRDHLLRATEQHVQQILAGNDASHDYSHIERVRRTALHLAVMEGLDARGQLVVQLGALLHDISDHKYGGSNQQAQAAIKEFLSSHNQAESLTADVCAVVASVGFKEELTKASGNSSSRSSLSREAAVVQDADRLDAIGAIGIARCFTFGGAFKRVLHDPAVPPRHNMTKEQYMQQGHQATTFNHFAEKLLKIKDLMKTDAGRQLAQQRHSFMEQYLQQFLAEWEGEA